MSGENGMVLSVEGPWAWVETRRTSACAGCGSRHQCRTADGGRMRVRARNAAGAAPGDTVRLHLDHRVRIKGLLLLYLAPVAGLMAGALAGAALASRLGLDGSLITVLCGGAGLGLAFLAVQRISRRMDAREELTPTVAAVLRRAAAPRPSGGLR